MNRKYRIHPLALGLATVLSLCMSSVAQAQSSQAGGLPAVEKRVAALEQLLNTAVTRIQTLEGQVSTLQGQASTLQGQVSTLESQVSTLETEKAQLQSDLLALESTVAGHTTGLAALNLTVVGHTTDIVALNTLTAPIPGQINTLQALTAPLPGRVTTLETKVGTKLDEVEEVGGGYLWIKKGATIDNSLLVRPRPPSLPFDPDPAAINTEGPISTGGSGLIYGNDLRLGGSLATGEPSIELISSSSRSVFFQLAHPFPNPTLEIYRRNRSVNPITTSPILGSIP